MELIVVGSITIDKNIFPNGKKEQTIGGPPIYAAATAQALKKKIGIVSKVGTDFQVKYLQTIKNYNSDLNGFRIKGKTSMRFENHYDEKGHRTQKLVSQSEKLSIKDFPDIYFDVPCVHLSPVFHEIPSELFEKLVSSFNFVSCDIQGFVRKKSSEEDNTLILNEWPNYEDFLPKIDLLKVDAQELKALTGESTLTKAIARINKKESVKILVITLAQKGSIIVFNGEQHKIPALNTNIVDLTGAGDTYITAFLLNYLGTTNPIKAGWFAAAAASFNIASIGPTNNYSEKKIQQKISQYKKK